MRTGAGICRVPRPGAQRCSESGPRRNRVLQQLPAQASECVLKPRGAAPSHAPSAVVPLPVSAAIQADSIGRAATRRCSQSSIPSAHVPGSRPAEARSWCRIGSPARTGLAATSAGAMQHQTNHFSDCPNTSSSHPARKRARRRRRVLHIRRKRPDELLHAPSYPTGRERMSRQLVRPLRPSYLNPMQVNATPDAVAVPASGQAVSRPTRIPLMLSALTRLCVVTDPIRAEVRGEDGSCIDQAPIKPARKFRAAYRAQMPRLNAAFAFLPDRSDHSSTPVSGAPARGLGEARVCGLETRAVTPRASPKLAFR